jgi:hypothetical protein
MEYRSMRIISSIRRLISWVQESLVLRGDARKERYIACLDEVTVTRDSDCARIEYREGDIAATLLEIGPGMREMTDREIVELHNECLRDEARRATQFKQVAFEMPLGSPQIEYFIHSDQWVPRGRVLRCLVQDDEHGQLVVRVDGRALRLKQFGKLLTSYEGWGMRIEFVPEQEVHRRPILEIREPKPGEWA